jgi:hypothetical protein
MLHWHLPRSRAPCTSTGTSPGTIHAGPMRFAHRNNIRDSTGRVVSTCTATGRLAWSIPIEGPSPKVSTAYSMAERMAMARSTPPNGTEGILDLEEESQIGISSTSSLFFAFSPSLLLFLMLLGSGDRHRGATTGAGSDLRSVWLLAVLLTLLRPPELSCSIMDTKKSDGQKWVMRTHI